ncbi:MAG: hypothetical protein KAT71_03625 [Gammaproteobacteria bacterium]|nr:hypothetical protein [Gammaproteobacteria bacterium]
MEYFKLVFNYKQFGDTCLSARDDLEADKYDLEKGAAIENWPKTFQLYYNSKKDGEEFTDYQNNTLDWFLVSNKLKNIISSLQTKNIQFLPINIFDVANGKIRIDYNVTNICNILENVFDFENTIFYGEQPKKKDAIYPPPKFYALKSKMIDKNIHIFKIREFPWSIFVSKEFKTLVTKNKLTGCAFMDVILT